MTAALVKKCNKCDRPFLKEDGCNKIICPCGNLQCYICSENVSTYDHFGNGKCPQYDDTVKRQRREVAKAQGRAIKDVLQKTADLTLEDVTVDKELLGVIKIKEKGTADVSVEEVEEAAPRPRELEMQRRNQDEEAIREVYRQHIVQQFQPRVVLQPGPPPTTEQRKNLRQRQRSAPQFPARPQVIRPGNWQWVPNDEMIMAGNRERERYEAEAALAAVRNFELWEQQMQRQREADEARAAAEAQRARRDTQVWEAFVGKSQSLYLPLEEEREVLRNGTPEEVELYWGMRTQNLIVFIAEAKQLVAKYDQQIKGQKWTEMDWHRHERSKALLSRAERELAQFREEAMIRKKHGLARSKSLPVEVKKVNNRSSVRRANRR